MQSERRAITRSCVINRSKGSQIISPNPIVMTPQPHVVCFIPSVVASASSSARAKLNRGALHVIRSKPIDSFRGSAGWRGAGLGILLRREPRLFGRSVVAYRLFHAAAGGLFA